jgi:hypothetical protein
VISDDEDDEIDESDNVINGQTDFMAYFFLASSTATELPRRNNSMIERSLSPKKKKKAAMRTRNVISKREKDLEKTIPFSSPAGLVLTKKCTVTEEYVEECLEDIDAFTQAKQTTKIPPRPRNRLLTGADTAVLKDMRKTRNYYWPKKHLHSMSSEANFEFLNRSLIEKLPVAKVEVHKLGESEIRLYQERLRMMREEKKRVEALNCVDLCSDSEDEAPPANDQMNFQGDFVMSVTDSRYRLISPGVSLLPPLPSKPPPLPEVFIVKTRRTSTTTTSISRQLFTSNLNLQELSTFTQTSAVTIASTSAKRSNDGDTNETRVKIQKWIQNVNGENFNTTNQVSVVNN